MGWHISHLSRLALLAAAAPLASCAGDASLPHPHQGILTRYQSLKPKEYGITLGAASTEDLRQGRPVMRVIEGKGGFKRAVSIQVRAPCSPRLRCVRCPLFVGLWPLAADRWLCR